MLGYDGIVTMYFVLTEVTQYVGTATGDVIEGGRINGIVSYGVEGIVTAGILVGTYVLGIIITDGDDGSTMIDEIGTAGIMSVLGKVLGNSDGVTITTIGFDGKVTNVTEVGSFDTGITTGELHVDGGITVDGKMAICPVNDEIGITTGELQVEGICVHVTIGLKGIIAVLKATVLGTLVDGTTFKQC
jgi:hypothetical protein